MAWALEILYFSQNWSVEKYFSLLFSKYSSTKDVLIRYPAPACKRCPDKYLLKGVKVLLVQSHVILSNLFLGEAPLVLPTLESDLADLVDLELKLVLELW